MARKTNAELSVVAQSIINQTVEAGNTKEIVGGFLQDVVDSMTNVDDGVGQGSVDTSGGTITLNMDNRAQRTFKGSASISGPKTWALSNTTNALEILYFIFTLTGLHAQTMPSNFKMSDARWDSVGKVWTPLDAGQYNAKAVFDGTSWLLIIDQNSGPFI